MSPLNQAQHLLLNVDASETARKAKTRVLSEAGYRVREAETGEEALLLAATLQPSLIVLDVALPGMDGVDVCRRIKQSAAMAHMMVLQVAAARSSNLERAACLDDGADGYLIEPIDPLELVTTVRGLLRLAERETDKRRLTEHLSRLERQFAEATEAADCGIWDWDIRSGKLEWFGKVERLAGLQPGGFSGKIEGFSDILHADDRLRVWQKLQDLIDRREMHFEDEYRFVHPDGSVHWMAAVGRFLYDEEGDAVRMMGVIQDITTRKLAEQRQQLESERRRLLACAAEQLLVENNPAELMTGVFETVRQHLDLDGYFYYRVARTGTGLALEASAGVADDIISKVKRLEFGQALCGTTAQLRAPVIYERLHESLEEKAQPLKALGFRAYACHPLIVGDRLLGVLSFSSRSRDRFEPDEIAFMQSICRYVAAATDRVQLEADMQERAQRLMESEGRLRAAMELNPQIPWTAYSDGSLEGINERWLQLSGLTGDEALDDSWMRVQHEEDLPRMIAAWTHSIQTGEAYDIEHRVRPESGGHRWMRTRAFPLRDDKGRIVRWYGTTEDIHDRKLVEEALRESRASLEGALQFREAVMANIKEGLYTLNSDGLVTYINPAAEALFGWTSAELLGRKMHPIIHYMHRDGTPFPAEACAGLQVLWEGKTLVEHADVFIRKDGTFFDVVYSSAPLWSDGKITGLVLVFRDVSDKRKAEQALRHSEERFRTMAQAVPSFLFETDAEGWNVWTSDAWCHFTGQTQEDVRGHGWAEALHPEDRAENVDRWVQCMREGTPFESRQRLRRRDGSYAWVIAKALPARDEQGTVRRWLGSVTDIDDIVRGQEALRESEALLATFLERLPVGVGLAGVGGRWTISNAMLRRFAPDIIPSHDDQRRSRWRVFDARGHLIPSHDWPTPRALRGETNGQGMEALYAGEDGKDIWMRVRSTPLRTDTGEVIGAITTLEEIDERKRAEEALRKSEEQLRAITDAVPSCIAYVDAEERYCFVNAEYERWFHRPRREIIGRSIEELFGADYTTVKPFIGRVLQGESVKFEHEIEYGGLQHTVLTSYTPDMREGGVVAGFYKLLTDITERKHAEAVLASAKERLEATLMATDVGLWQWYFDEDRREADRNLKRIFAVEDIDNVPVEMYVQRMHPADRQRVDAAIQRVVREGGRYEEQFRVVRPDGTVRWIHARGYVDRDAEGRPRSFPGIALDITERKEAEEALRRSEERLQLAQGAAHIGTFDWDIENGRVLWSPELEQIWGLPLSGLERTYDEYRGHVHRDDLAQAEVLLQRALTDPAAPYAFEHRIIRPDGIVRWIYAKATTLWDELGRPVRMVGINMDITERKWAEERLKEQARLDSFTARIGKQLIESRDLGGLLRGCTQTMVDDLDAAFARIWTLNEQDNVLELKASSGLYTNLEGRHARVPVGSLKIGLIAAERKPNLTNHVVGDPRVPEQEWARREGMVAFAGYPLVIEDRVVGVMAMFSRHALSESTLQAMSMVADHIALGIQRKRAEQALRESEEQLRLSLDASLAGTWSWDVATNRSMWDQRYHDLYGFEAQESRSFETWIGRVHPADRERLLARVQSLLTATGDDTWSEEFRAFHPVTGERWMQGIGRVERNETGKAVRFAGINLDITDRKMAEQALAANEQRMRFAMQAARMASWDWDVLTGHCMWSELHFSLLGYEPNPTGEGSLEMWESRVHPDDRDRVMAELESAKREHRLYRPEYRAVRADNGQIIWLSATGQFFYDEHGSAVRSFGVFYDITERKLAEESLGQQRERLTLALQAGQMGVYDWNMVDDQLWWSPEIYALFGVAPEHFAPTRESFIALVHPQDREALWRRIEEAIGKRHLFVHEFRIVQPDGAIRWIANQAQTEYDDSGRPVRHFGIASDITERKEVEEALRRQEEQLRVITDAVPSFIAYVDREERYRFVNAEYEKWFHRPRREILGRSVRDLLKGSYAEVEPYISRVLNGEAVRFERGVQSGGFDRTVLTSYSPDMREDGTVAGFYVLVMDITDQKQHEDALRRWKDALEERVAERTQELVASQSRLRALASQLNLAEQRERRKLALDLHDYLAQLLVVGRMKIAQIAKQPALTPAAQVIARDVDSLFQQALIYTRTMIADLCPPSLHDAGLPAALRWLGERMQKEGLWVEVCSNKVEIALPEDRAVLLFYSVRELLFNVLKHAGVDRATVRLTVEDGGDVRVTVEDGGKGLDPRDLDRASQPGHFGLFGVRERMESIGGRLEVTSTPGTGTVVLLVLPAVHVTKKSV